MLNPLNCQIVEERNDQTTSRPRMKLLLLADVIYTLVSRLKRSIRAGLVWTGNRPWWNRIQTCTVLLIQAESQLLSFWICLCYLIEYVIIFPQNNLEKLPRGLTLYRLEVVLPILGSIILFCVYSTGTMVFPVSRSVSSSVLVWYFIHLKSSRFGWQRCVVG